MLVLGSQVRGKEVFSPNPELTTGARDVHPA